MGLLSLLLIASGPSQASPPATSEPPLVPPMLLQKKALDAGNPLATYAAMLEREQRYLASKPLAGVYREVRLNFEEFLGVPTAGLEAMRIVGARANLAADGPKLPSGFDPEDALAVVEREARKSRVVVWAEEHHLPQTRSLYEALLKRLRPLGYKYLAAEAFTDHVTEPGFKAPDYKSGYYLLDPVFASAVREAQRLGYTLVSYDASEQGPRGDASYRDRTQAANIKARVLDRDPAAKVLVLVGRGHASEQIAADGWTPMASVLKRATGIDPFTVYAPTMGQRLTPSEEHPWYRDADGRGLVKRPTIFVERNSGRPLGSAAFDAYVFWPRFTVVDGRPDWMESTMGRRRVSIPAPLRTGAGRRLVQAHVESDPATSVPIDQFLLAAPDAPGALMLSSGRYRLRAIDDKSTILGTADVDVR